MKTAPTPETHELRDRAVTRDRLLDAAERLFAQKGVAETSVRAITAEAGMNVAAVNYYFASKDQLYEAVIERRLPALIQAREAGLSAALAEGGDVASILRAWILPSIRLWFARPHFARLASRLRFEDDSVRWQQYRARQDGLVGRYETALQTALPHLSAEEIASRLRCVFGLVSYQLAHDASVAEESEELIVARLVAFSAAGIAAP